MFQNSILFFQRSWMYSDGLKLKDRRSEKIFLQLNNRRYLQSWSYWSFYAREMFLTHIFTIFYHLFIEIFDFWKDENQWEGHFNVFCWWRIYWWFKLSFSWKGAPEVLNESPSDMEKPHPRLQCEEIFQGAYIEPLISLCFYHMLYSPTSINDIITYFTSWLI